MKLFMNTMGWVSCLCGFASLSYGAWLVWDPLGFLVGGLALLFLAFIMIMESMQPLPPKYYHITGKHMEERLETRDLPDR